MLVVRIRAIVDNFCWTMNLRASISHCHVLASIPVIDQSVLVPGSLLPSCITSSTSIFHLDLPRFPDCQLKRTCRGLVFGLWIRAFLTSIAGLSLTELIGNCWTVCTLLSAVLVGNAQSWEGYDVRAARSVPYPTTPATVVVLAADCLLTCLSDGVCEPPKRRPVVAAARIDSMLPVRTGFLGTRTTTGEQRGPGTVPVPWSMWGDVYISRSAGLSATGLLEFRLPPTQLDYCNAVD